MYLYIYDICVTSSFLICVRWWDNDRRMRDGNVSGIQNWYNITDRVTETYKSLQDKNCFFSL